ncbi:hypothetical protein ACFL67_03130, partial [candidate division KSB1 bacterium]
GIEADEYGNIWICSFKKQITEVMYENGPPYTNILHFVVINRNGKQLTTIDYDIGNYYEHMLDFKVCYDRLFIVDPEHKMAVYEYKINFE